MNNNNDVEVEMIFHVIFKLANMIIGNKVFNHVNDKTNKQNES